MQLLALSEKVKKMYHFIFLLENQLNPFSTIIIVISG